jgi:hypothetical protein
MKGKLEQEADMSYRMSLAAAFLERGNLWRKVEY